MKLFARLLPAENTVLLLAGALHRGGAERQLVTLANGLAHRGYDVAVALFYDGGGYRDELDQAGVRIIDLRKMGRWDIFPFMGRLVQCLRRERPEVLHSYLGTPNIVAAVSKFIMRETRVVWSVRASDMMLSEYDWFARLSYALECRLATIPDRIIANSYAGMRHAISNGFPEDRITVVPNGIDTSYFCFDVEGRKEARAGWGIRDDEILVGVAARLDPMKGHLIFLEAASCVLKERQNVRFVCVGREQKEYAGILGEQSAKYGLGDQILWVGEQEDMPKVFSAIDIVCSPSLFGEGFSNTIAEAMACNVPCVVTDVGDSAHIVGDTGGVVAPGDVSALAKAIQCLVDVSPADRRQLGEKCRARITSEFSIDKLIRRTERILGLTASFPEQQPASQDCGSAGKTDPR